MRLQNALPSGAHRLRGRLSLMQAPLPHATPNEEASHLREGMGEDGEDVSARPPCGAASRMRLGTLATGVRAQQEIEGSPQRRLQ